MSLAEVGWVLGGGSLGGGAASARNGSATESTGSRRRKGLQQSPSIASRSMRPNGRTESQYCSEGKVVTYLRCVVQLQMLCTSHPFAVRTVTTASGTQSSPGSAGHGGMNAEHRHASNISSAPSRNCERASAIAAVKFCAVGFGQAMAAMRRARSQSYGGWLRNQSVYASCISQHQSWTA